jgi:hypothetical protein
MAVMMQREMMGTAVSKKDAMGRVRQEISIQRLLEWAFADECASVDFEDAGTLAQGYGGGGPEWVMMQRGVLGCKVDGGGRSDPHPDADLVAAAVAVLPEGCGGRSMAVQIAELSRHRRVPDAMVGVDPRPHVRPVETKRNKYGTWGGTEHVCYVTDVSGRKPKRFDARVCPVAVHNPAGQIAQARRNYLQWRLALVDLRQTFVVYNNMSRWALSDVLPSMRPWLKTV